MSRQDADLVIAGAGCAGLSALWHVLHSPLRDLRIIVIDQSFGPHDDRQWAFWGPHGAPFAHLADQHWNHLEVGFPEWRATSRLRGPRRGQRSRAYHRVHRRTYDGYVLETARQHPNVRFVEQPITDVRDDADAGVVVLPEGELRAPVVFQSTTPVSDHPDRPPRHPLRQHFGGWDVRVEHDVFRPGVVTLMDFDAPQHDGTAFFYVLPEAPDRAFIEYTLFSTTPRSAEFYDEHLLAKLAALGAGDHEIRRAEYGVIPMEDGQVRRAEQTHVWDLGTVGGMTKPSTGYTFQRIHAHSRRLVDSWASTGAPADATTGGRRYPFLDRTLLRLLHHHPDRGRGVFERLFATTAVDDVLTFLDEASSLTDDARMMTRLPWPPFVRSALGEVGDDVRDAMRRRRSTA
ncbi:MAG: lycopene cyclase family protein [Actinomycetota bacterium]